MLMERSLATTVVPLPLTRKASARAALIELKDPVRSVISECFRQFGIETTILGADAADRLKREKFEACVLKLSSPAGQIMEAARNSPSNSRMIIYGLGGSAQDALRFSKYGVNAIFREPLERTAAIKLVRATQMLVLHEMRRYVRIPVITETNVIVMNENRRFNATSIEVSSGGMSMRSNEDLSPGQTVEISFALLTLPRVWVRASVSWRNPVGKAFGIRFDSADARRQRVKDWVDAYLEN
ncbi:MAG TPA: PilZ domain-containing protein [Terriglobales bacterium]|nr:PilZ domain-containing protein [Terriglobales bacterium]